MKKVIPLDMWTMILCTIRYSMGRQTYMVSAAPGLVYDYEEYLTDEQLKQIVREIRREIADCERLGNTLGSDYDHESWKLSANEIEKILEKRRLHAADCEEKK